MLTGDHPLTAVSIGHSSGLIDKSFTSVILQNCDTIEISSKLIPVIDTDEKIQGNIVIVITGEVLSYINLPEKKGLLKIFKLACDRAKCFIGSRVSPKQKAEIVLLIKEQHPDHTTLAIGDGANDVNMITSADVGIGISGVEGTQAARASDYSIGQFSFLRRLLFVHGRESYRKNAFAVGYMLWKNFMYILPNVFLGFQLKFDGSNCYDPFIDIMYNVIFTAFPIGWYATADKQFEYKILERMPQMYVPGMKNAYFNNTVFWKWYLYSFIMSALIYWFAVEVFINNITNQHEMFDFTAFGAAIYFNIVLFVNFKLLLSTHSHDFLSLSLQVFSVGMYMIVLLFTSNFIMFQTYGNADVLLKAVVFYLEGFLVVAVGLLMEYGWRSVNFFIYEIFLRNVDRVDKRGSIVSGEYKHDEKDEGLSQRDIEQIDVYADYADADIDTERIDKLKDADVDKCRNESHDYVKSHGEEDYLDRRTCKFF